MIMVVHGGQTGVDRGAHEAAIDNGWLVAGYMPRDGRDERGPIPPDVARYLQRHEHGYAARTDANVRSCDALLVVVRDYADPRATPGTARTIALSSELGKRTLVVDPSCQAQKPIAEWIWWDLLRLPGLFEVRTPRQVRLMVAGPRESKWGSARIETADLLRRVGLELRDRKSAP